MQRIIVLARSSDDTPKHQHNATSFAPGLLDQYGTEWRRLARMMSDTVIPTIKLGEAYEVRE